MSDKSYQILTPIWTGGVRGKVDRIHETAILGSLRWWYELFVRGLGGKACDPSNAVCKFDDEKYRKSSATDKRHRLHDAGLCDVCQVFGATGWKRQFRLIIDESEAADAPIQYTVRLNACSYVDAKGNTRTPTWWFPDPTQSRHAPNTPKTGRITLQVQSLHQDFDPAIIHGLIQFCADWTAIGARAQMGFGVIQPDGERADTTQLYQRLATCIGGAAYTDLPSLSNLFLARIRLNGATDTATFNLKCKLRRLFTNRDLRHFIMGTVKDGRIAAKVKMSRPYADGLIRIWGWIPEDAREYRSGWNRNSVVGTIYQHLRSDYTPEVWRELNSPRDTVKTHSTNALAFLQDLLGVEEVGNAI